MLSNKKVAFIIHGLQMGGAEKFLINNVNNFYKNGYQPVVILLSEEKALVKDLDEKIKVITITKAFRYDLTITKKIKRVIKQEGISKVFCVNTYPFFLTKLAFLFDKKTTFYLSLHSTVPVSRKRHIENLIYLRFVSKNDKVIYVCNNQRSYLQKKYYLSAGDGVVIHNGIDPSYFDPDLFKDLDVKDLRKEYNLNDGDKVIVKVARLYTEKGHFDAIKALHFLHEKYKLKAHLLLVGGGELTYILSLKDYVIENGLAQYVHFTGNHFDVRKFYCISNIFTLTSFTETFSLAALEAMAFGLPCSLTDLGGANEMVIEGITGALSKAKDPLSIAASWNKLLNKELNSSNIRQFVVENFNAKRMLKEYLELVDNS